MSCIKAPTRVVGIKPNLSTYGCYGTIVGQEPVDKHWPRHPGQPQAGVLYDVVWLDFPDEGPDEIDGGNLKVVSEETYCIEAIERRIDAQ